MTVELNTPTIVYVLILCGGPIFCVGMLVGAGLLQHLQERTKRKCSHHILRQERPDAKFCSKCGVNLEEEIVVAVRDWELANDP